MGGKKVVFVESLLNALQEKTFWQYKIVFFWYSEAGDISAALWNMLKCGFCSHFVPLKGIDTSITWKHILQCSQDVVWVTPERKMNVAFLCLSSCTGQFTAGDFDKMSATKRASWNPVIAHKRVRPHIFEGSYHACSLQDILCGVCIYISVWEARHISVAVFPGKGFWSMVIIPSCFQIFSLLFCELTGNMVLEFADCCCGNKR